MTRERITIEDLATCTLRHIAHLDGPRGPQGWFGDMHICVEHPRLQRIDRAWRATRTVTVAWSIDGHEVGPVLDDVVPLLNVPPRLTAEEGVFLRLVTPDWQDLRERGGNLGLGPLFGLRNKGVVEFKEGKCRLLESSAFRLGGGEQVFDAPAGKDAYLALLRADAGCAS